MASKPRIEVLARVAKVLPELVKGKLETVVVPTVEGNAIRWRVSARFLA